MLQWHLECAAEHSQTLIQIKHWLKLCQHKEPVAQPNWCLLPQYSKWGRESCSVLWCWYQFRWTIFHGGVTYRGTNQQRKYSITIMIQALCMINFWLNSFTNEKYNYFVITKWVFYLLIYVLIYHFTTTWFKIHCSFKIFTLLKMLGLPIPNNAQDSGLYKNTIVPLL